MSDTITLPTRHRQRRGPRTTRYAFCIGCGKRGRTEAHCDYQCADCRERDGGTCPIDLSFHALTDGSWVRRGLIWHWQPNATTETPS